MLLSRSRRFWFLLAGTASLVTVAVAFSLFRKPPGRHYDPSKNSFDGSSESLDETVVVPTLDTPIPDKKSAIWCSSFQLAWNHLKTDVAQEAIQLKNAQAVADRLNRAEQTEDDLDAKDFYAAAGTVKDGIIPKIQARNGAEIP